MRPDADDATYACAWREFEDRHLGHIKRFVEARLGDVDDATVDEVLIETEWRVLKGISRYQDRGHGKLRSWCFKVAQRVLHDLWRGHAPFAPDGPSGAGELLSFDEIAEQYSVGSFEDCESVVVKEVSTDAEPRPLTEREQVMREAFATLSEVDQSVLWGGINGDTDAYLASNTGKPIEHVRKIRYKAQKKLIKAFESLMAKRHKAS
jgi:DNA-directed RNA polymerase specialized sigma24 family protein